MFVAVDLELVGSVVLFDIFHVKERWREELITFRISVSMAQKKKKTLPNFEEVIILLYESS